MLQYNLKIYNEKNMQEIYFKNSNTLNNPNNKAIYKIICGNDDKFTLIG